MGCDFGYRYEKDVFPYSHSMLRTLFVPVGYGDNMFPLSKWFNC